LRWLVRFAGYCSSAAAEAGLAATLALNERTATLFDALDQEGLEVEMRREGVLLVYRSPESFDSARKKLDAAGEQVQARVLSRDEALAVEPLLLPSACAGAIHYTADRHVRPEKFVAALAARLKEMGAEIRTGAPCSGILREGSRVVGVRTPSGTVRGRTFVLATGASLSALARDAGVRIPVQGGKGHSFDVPREDLPARVPVYLYEDRVALTPFDEVTRVAGMMELGARTTAVRPRAIETMDRVGRASFETWPAAGAPNGWAGLRPMTPDGLPVIGGVDGIENLFVAGGHGMLGVTLSLRTGEAIANFVSGSDGADPTLRPFSPTRFTR
jgi:D-amino-acid dehydrogenase